MLEDGVSDLEPFRRNRYYIYDWTGDIIYMEHFVSNTLMMPNWRLEAMECIIQSYDVISSKIVTYIPKYCKEKIFYGCLDDLEYIGIFKYDIPHNSVLTPTQFDDLILKNFDDRTFGKISEVASSLYVVEIKGVKYCIRAHNLLYISCELRKMVMFLAVNLWWLMNLAK